MYIGIKNNKIFDIVSDMRHIRDLEDKEVRYLEREVKGDISVGDSWDSKKEINLRNSPQRFELTPKTDLELKIEELENRIKELETYQKKLN